MLTPTPPDLPQRAAFNPLLRPYFVIYGAGVLAMTLVGLPLALLWLCGVGQWWARHYFERLECELGETALRFRKGILVQVEKTIPLENIQDVTFIEGPLLRRFNLSVLRFETAGQSANQGNEMKLVGVIDAAQLRQRILAQRDVLRQRHAQAGTGSAAPQDEQLALMRAMLARLDEIAASLRPPQG
ncbi:PH domain-containing protein [Ideonella dechloratans]|uniref:PH domain-containing protein n=1 Tax=Ideonella dechloratans TaxID=36863 RepID=UPI0035B4DCDB